MEAYKEGMRRLTVELPASLHTQFKTEVSRQGLEIRAVVIPLLESWMIGESKIKIQPAGRSFEPTINPGVDGWENSIEKIVDRIVEKKLAMKETENGNLGNQFEVRTTKPMEESEKKIKTRESNLKVHTVEPVIPIEEKPAVAEEEIVAEDGVVAETVITGKKVAVAKKAKAKKKVWKGGLLGIPWWGYDVEVDDEEEEKE